MSFKAYKSILLLVLALSFAASANANSNILNLPKGGKATSVGIYIKNLETGKVIANNNADRVMTPASITKSITTATALSMLGPDFRFTTDVELIGYRRNNRWNGNLVINASGDPSLGSKEMELYDMFTDTIIALLQDMGIEKISGSIVVNEGLRDAGPVDNWEYDDLRYAYGTGLHGFNYCNNQDSVDVWTNPASKYTQHLSAKLAEAEIELKGMEFDEVEDLDTMSVVSYQSPTALEICKSLMHRSDNLFAEGMLRAIAPDSTRRHCIKLEKQFLDSIGIDSEQTILLDGSGLSRANSFSPRFIGNLLEHMAESNLADEYVSTFPVAGRDGTLKRFLRKTSLEGKLALKTGSMRSVQCYAGYKLDKNGSPTHVVVVMVNGFFCPRRELHKQIEKYLLKIF